MLPQDLYAKWDKTSSDPEAELDRQSIKVADSGATGDVSEGAGIETQ